MATFLIKRNDRLPELIWAIYLLTDGVKSFMDLTDVTDVIFNMKLEYGSVLKVSGVAASVEDAVLGRVKYQFAAADTDTAGTYYGEFVLTFSDGRKLSVPSRKEDLVIEIHEDLDGIV